MSFKFTLLGIEVSTRRNKCENVETMVRTKQKKQTKSKKLSSAQKRFVKAVRKCHSKTKTPKSYGSCMRKELKK